MTKSAAVERTTARVAACGTSVLARLTEQFEAVADRYLNA